MAGAYVGLTLFTLGTPNMFLALFLAAAVTFALGALIEIIAFRYLRNAPHFSSLLVTIGISVILINLAHVVFGPETRAVAPGMIEDLAYEGIEVSGVYITYLQMAVLGVALLMMVATYVFLEHTSVGLAIRATSQDHEAAYAMGVNVNRIFTLTFAFASMMGGIAGVLIGLYYNIFVPNMGTLLGIKAFSASVVGGLTSMPGAIVAGLLIGVIESFAVDFWNASYRHLVAFVFMIVILVFRPAGLFGKKNSMMSRGD